MKNENIATKQINDMQNDEKTNENQIIKKGETNKMDNEKQFEKTAATEENATIEDKYTADNFSAGTTEEQAAEQVAAETMSVDTSNEGFRPTLRMFELCGGATATVNLFDGSSSVDIPFVSGEGLKLPINISLVYKRGMGESPYGGFRLNIDEKFIKISDGKYRYTDNLGNYHDFTEAYHYRFGGFAYAEVEPEEVMMGNDGELYYRENAVTKYKVKKRLFSNTALKAVTEMVDLKNVKYIDQHEQNLFQASEKVAGYKNVLMNYVVLDTSIPEIVFSNEGALTLGNLTKEEYEVFLAKAKEENKMAVLLDVAREYKEAARQYDSISEAPDSLIKQATLADLERRMTTIKANKRSCILQLEQYYREYLRAVDEQRILKKNTPINYLSSGDIIRGFNEDGALVVIFDNHENAIAIDRDDYGKIIKVYDENNNAITFEYEDNVLSGVRDARGKYSSLSRYSSSTEINHSDGQTIMFEVSNGNLTAVSSSFDKLSATLTYSGLNRLEKILRRNAAYNIAHNSHRDDIVTTFETVLIAYLANNIVTVTTDDDWNSKQTYKFESYGDLSEYYEEKNSLVVHAEKHEFIHYAYDNVTYAKSDTLWRTPLSEFEFVDGKIVEKDINEIRLVSKKRTFGDWLDTNTNQDTLTTYDYDENDRVIREHTTVNTWYSGTNKKVYHLVKEYQYNSYGSLMRTESYVEEEILTAGKMIEERIYDDEGKINKIFSYNSLEPTTRFYSVDNSDKNMLDTEEKTARTSHYFSDVEERTLSSEFGEENRIRKSYTSGLLTRITSGDTSIDYTYDAKRDLYSCSTGFGDMQWYTRYVLDDNELNTKVKRTNIHEYTYNGHYVDEDARGNIVREQYGSETQILIRRNADGNPTSINDGKVHVLEYDTLGRCTDSGYGETYSYNTDGKIKGKGVFTDEGSVTYIYTYGSDYAKDLTSIKVDSSTVNPKKDVHGRYTGKTISRGAASSALIIAQESITYRKVGDHATNMPSTERYGNRVNGIYYFTDSVKYRYDARGNISEIWENGKLTVRYTYDTIGRLVREDNRGMSKTTVVTYDNNGNILSKREFAFSLKPTEALEELSSTDKSYFYLEDKLMSYNGEKCEYSSGKPTMYRGKEITWSREKYISTYGTNTYSTDGRGLRLTKGNIAFSYGLNGELLSQSNNLFFLYDHSGLMGVKHNNTTYYYRKNVLGDITAILDSNGSVVVKYIYDAWGNHKVLDSSGSVITSATHIGNLNPFRYRSYYYDTETGLYYLKARYYDPEVGRFISADDLAYVDPNHVNGTNLYAYCNNNPVMNVDPEGHLLGTVLAVLGTIALGTLLGGFAEGISTAIQGGKFWIGFVSGAVSGLITTIGMGLALAAGPLAGLGISAIFGFAGGVGSSVIKQGLSKGWDRISRKELLVSGAISAATSVASYFLMRVSMIGTGLFDNVFDKGISFGQRFINAMSIDKVAAVLTLIISPGMSFEQSWFSLLYDILEDRKNQYGMAMA